MSDKQSIDAAGTPRPGYIFAIFDSQDGASDAKNVLAGMGVVAEAFEPADAEMLKRTSDDAGVVASLRRFLKNMGGESNMATRYADHLARGRRLLAVPVADNAAAEQLTKVLTGHGGYDVTYFRDWSIQYMSPSENIERNEPTHSSTNTGE
jgi:hypothetical protein